MGNTPLRTQRFLLELLDGSTAHSQLYRGLYTCPEVMAHIAPPLTAQVADAAFERACRHNTRALPGHRFWAVRVHGSAEPVGLVALQRSGECAEIGAMLVPAWWNRRVCSEVFVELIAYAFMEMRVETVLARGEGGDRGEMLARLLRPFRFQSVSDPAPPPGQRRWQLPRSVWEARQAPAPI